MSRSLFSAGAVLACLLVAWPALAEPRDAHDGARTSRSARAVTPAILRVTRGELEVLEARCRERADESSCLRAATTRREGRASLRSDYEAKRSIARACQRGSTRACRALFDVSAQELRERVDVPNAAFLDSLLSACFAPTPDFASCGLYVRTRASLEYLPDDERARLARDGCEHGDAASCAYAYFERGGATEEESIDRLARGCELGSALACVVLGEAYASHGTCPDVFARGYRRVFGEPPPGDAARAGLQLLRRACESGVGCDAMFSLASRGDHDWTAPSTREAFAFACEHAGVRCDEHVKAVLRTDASDRVLRAKDLAIRHCAFAAPEASCEPGEGFDHAACEGGDLESCMRLTAARIDTCDAATRRALAHPDATSDDCHPLDRRAHACAQSAVRDACRVLRFDEEEGVQNGGVPRDALDLGRLDRACASGSGGACTMRGSVALDACRRGDEAACRFGFDHYAKACDAGVILACDYLLERAIVELDPNPPEYRQGSSSPVHVPVAMVRRIAERACTEQRQPHGCFARALALAASGDATDRARALADMRAACAADSGPDACGFVLRELMPTCTAQPRGAACDERMSILEHDCSDGGREACDAALAEIAAGRVVRDERRTLELRAPACAASPEACAPLIDGYASLCSVGNVDERCGRYVEWLFGACMNGSDAACGVALDAMRTGRGVPAEPRSANRLEQELCHVRKARAAFAGRAAQVPECTIESDDGSEARGEGEGTDGVAYGPAEAAEPEDDEASEVE